MKQLDFDRAFSKTPECIHESIHIAFEKGEKAMKFRHKLTSVLSVAAALVAVFGVTALGLHGIERPVDDAVTPLSSTLSQTADANDATAIGGRDLPAGAEIYVDVDPDAIVPVFYASREAISGETDADRFVHMDIACARMQQGKIYEVPLLGAVNEAGLGLCPDCFTLGDMPVCHDGEVACLPYHTPTGQESTLAAAIEDRLTLCEKCFKEVYTAADDPYMHCSDACLQSYSKKFIHSASAAGLDACPECMPLVTDPDTGREARLISSIPMPTPEPEDYAAANVNLAEPTPEPTVTESYTIIEPTPTPDAEITQMPYTAVNAAADVSYTDDSGAQLDSMQVVMDGDASAYAVVESTPVPIAADTEIAQMSYTAVNASSDVSYTDDSGAQLDSMQVVMDGDASAYAVVESTPAPDANLYLNMYTSTFYSTEGDLLVHAHAYCDGTDPVSLPDALSEGKSFCPDCCSELYMLTASDRSLEGGEYFHAHSGCTMVEDISAFAKTPLTRLIQEGHAPCPECFREIYIKNSWDDCYHLRDNCADNAQQSYLGFALANDMSACPECADIYDAEILNAAATAGE